jgi:hypothetical protein
MSYFHVFLFYNAYILIFSYMDITSDESFPDVNNNNNNLIICYLCAEYTATKAITDTAQCRFW